MSYLSFQKVTRYWLPALPILAVVAPLLLPLNLLVIQRFHHDEALYATWALKITSGQDPWLAETPVDKPPLYLYTLAGVMGALGVSETVARLPSLAATALIVLLTFALGRKLYSDAVGLLAAWLVALSPFMLAFAPTALTDPLLVALVLAGSLAAVYQKAGWAGFFSALAIATKQQGLFFLPLQLLLLAATSPSLSDIKKDASYAPRTIHYILRTTHYASRFILSLTLILLPFFLWDYSRNQPSAFFEQSLSNYGGLGSDVASFAERGWGFIELLRYGTASPLLNGIFVIGYPLLLMIGAWRLRKGERVYLFDGLLGLFILLFLWLHAFLSFQVWDRYLLGLIPLLALLLARILLLPGQALRFLPGPFRRAFFDRLRGDLRRQLRRALRQAQGTAQGTAQGMAQGTAQGAAGTGANNSLVTKEVAGLGFLLKGIGGVGLALLVGLSLARPVQDAVQGRYPLGSNSRALAGIEQVVAYLQGKVGANQTLYHHWLGTHWRFYLWGYPYDLQYWATPAELAASAQPGELIAFPAWQSDTEARLALFEQGLVLQELTRAYTPGGAPSLILYRIERY